MPFGTYNVTNPGRGDDPRGRGAHPAQRRLRQGVLVLQRRGRIHAAGGQDAPLQLRPGRRKLARQGIVLTPVQEAIERRLRQWKRTSSGPMNLLVTGGCGFIGSNFIRQRLAEGGGPLGRLVNLDKLTYAGNPANLADLAGDPRYVFVQGDIGDEALVSRLLAEHAIDAVVNFAAESHVDRSIDSPRAVHPDQRRRHPPPARRPRGAIGRGSPSPSKRGVPIPACVHRRGLRDPGPGRSRLHRGDALRARTAPTPRRRRPATTWCGPITTPTACPTLTTNCSNNYGPYQFPEKLIPLVILNALDGKPLPVYGDGQQVRDWLYVEDHAERDLAGAASGAASARPTTSAA